MCVGVDVCVGMRESTSIMQPGCSTQMKQSSVEQGQLQPCIFMCRVKATSAVWLRGYRYTATSIN